jgi:hypothetical protein
VSSDSLSLGPVLRPVIGSISTSVPVASRFERLT